LSINEARGEAITYVRDTDFGKFQLRSVIFVSHVLVYRHWYRWMERARTLRLRFDIHCQYWKSIVYVTCSIDFWYWQWISKRNLKKEPHIVMSRLLRIRYAHGISRSRCTAPTAPLAVVITLVKSSVRMYILTSV